MFDWRDYKNGIVAFDADYVRPMLAAIHMVIEKERVALIDTGSNDTVPRTLEALKHLGLTAETVDYVVLTHIHLDHAGGAGMMMQAFPNAKLVVHPRGARHMIEPSKLLAGVCAVYGKEYVDRVYGRILPVSSTRIIEAGHQEVISLAGRELICLDTPGHARHHICILDRKTGGVFSGDTFGLSYREFDVGHHQFIFPTTTPTQFDPDAMHRSIDLLLSFRPEAIYLTHYSRVHDVTQLGQDLHRRLDMHVAIALQAQASDTERHQGIKSRLTRYLLDELERHGCTFQESTILDRWAMDLELNAQGLGVWLDTRAAAQPH